MKQMFKWSGAMLMAMLFLSPSCFARDLSLEDAIGLALSGNTGLRITQKNEIAAEEAVTVAKGENGVSAKVSDNLSVSKNSNSDRSTSNGLNVSGSLPLYSGGRNQAEIYRTELALDAAGLATERERENLKSNVINAYYTALEARHTIEVRQDTVNRYQDHLNLTTSLFQAGSKARIDVIDMNVQLSNAQQDLIRAKNTYEVDLAKLRDYINIDRSEPLRLTTDFVYQPFSSSLNQAVAYAYTNRKDLLADIHKLCQYEESLKSAKSAYLPSVDLSLSAGQTNAIEPHSDSTQDIRGTVGLSWSIFDSGITRARVKSANNDIDVALLKYQKDKEAADLSVREAYHNMREAEQRFNSTGNAVRLAEENYYIAREKYRVGAGLMVDITDAQASLATARLNEISAKYDYVRYKAAVENAMGISLTDSERMAADRLAPVLLPKIDVSKTKDAVDSGTYDRKAANESSRTSAAAKKNEDKAQAPEQRAIQPTGRKTSRDTKSVEEGQMDTSDNVARELAGEVTK